MIKKIILLLITAAMVYAVGFSPYSIPQFLQNSSNLRSVLATYDNNKREFEDSERTLAEARNEFVSKRNFEVAYSDIERVIDMLGGAMNITVSSVNTADPHQFFTPGSIWDGQEQPEAVIVSMAVGDSVSALRIIDKLQLPVYEVTISEPSMVNITFLTGGASE